MKKENKITNKISIKNQIRITPKFRDIKNIPLIELSSELSQVHIYTSTIKLYKLFHVLSSFQLNPAPPQSPDSPQSPQDTTNTITDYQFNKIKYSILSDLPEFFYVHSYFKFNEISLQFENDFYPIRAASANAPDSLHSPHLASLPGSNDAFNLLPGRYYFELKDIRNHSLVSSHSNHSITQFHSFCMFLFPSFSLYNRLGSQFLVISFFLYIIYSSFQSLPPVSSI